MTSFSGVEKYFPVLVLVTGLSTFLGVWATGRSFILCTSLRRLPSPWNQVTSILIGIQVLSLTVQILAMAGIASRLILEALWWIIVVVGAAMLIATAHGRAVSFSSRERLAWPLFAIIGIAVAADLLVAIAPSTQSDAIYYHMLLPSRIVTEGALHFYREPWEGAILPDMIFQIASAPAHAIGYPDAANVVSWALRATLLWFAWRVIRAQGKPVAWSALWVGSLCVGIYAAVWQVAGSAYAMGDLAMAAALIAFCTREHLAKSASPSGFALMFSVLLLSAATSKISLLPLCAIILFLGILPLLRLFDYRTRRNVLITAALPWIVFFGPITVWTWVEAGSPFGPIFSGAFASAISPNNWAAEIEGTRQSNQFPLSLIFVHVPPNYSPLMWLGLIAVFFFSDLPKKVRVELFLFLVLQCVLIWWLLPYDPRFLGGLYFGLVIAFAAFARPPIQDKLASARLILVSSAVLLLPWLGIQIYYAKQFFSISLGLEKRAFYERHIAFYKDYVELDHLLSSDTVLLVQGFSRPSAVYAPRPIFFDPADLPKGKEIVLFAPPSSVPDDSLGGYKRGEIIYKNPKAVIVTFRTPGRNPIIGSLEITRLVGGDKSKLSYWSKPGG